MPPGEITRADVVHVAGLARLELTEEEAERFTEQLATVLTHAAAVQALDTDGVPPSAHPLPISNVFRKDEVAPSLARAEVLAEAPDAEDGYFRVPRILHEEP